MPFTVFLSWFVENMTATSIIVLLTFVISGWYSNRWDWFFDWSSRILGLSEPEFKRLRERLERLITSFFPCLAIALFLFGLYVMSVSLQPEAFRFEGFPMYVSNYWWICTSFMITLLLGLGVWLIISMWIGVYITFRQPLNVKLSRWTSRDFRPLAIWSLKASLLYFIGSTILLVILFYVGLISGGIPGFAVSTAPSIIIGVMAFLLPFYNIHRTLVKLKEQELEKIEEESNKLTQELTETMAKHPTGDSKDHLMRTMSHLINLNILHIRERNVVEAEEWPIDTTVLSIFSAILLTPILTQILIEVLFGVFMV